MPCLDDSRIVAFAQGLLEPSERAAIRSHIELCPLCASLVAEAARDSQPTKITSPGFHATPAPTPALVRGTSVGRYLLLQQIGEGGLGQVFTAYDPELDRRVAIKLIKPAALKRADRDELSARLVREAQALARVQHPNVVAVHDAGSYDDGVFVAMELVAGTTLRVWLRDDHPWRVTRDLFVAAGRGLVAAHAAGLVHRDFKPSNVLIAESGRVQVADFGLARAVVGAAPARAAPGPAFEDLGSRMLESITQPGALVGTPAYMAPEQLQGGAVDAQADQFSYCVALFEALYRVRPFGGDSVDARLEAIRAQQWQAAPRQPNVPKWLRRVVTRGLRADPKARHAGMVALLAALQRDRRTRRWQGASAAGLVVAASVGAWAGALVAGPTDEERSRVERLEGEVQAAAARARFVYPPADDPTGFTAYTKLLELEALEGASESLADERAAVLRASLSSTLVGLGDRFWDRAGGAVFATDYYAAAVMFDPGNGRARTRMRVTPVQLQALGGKAASLDFTAGELAAAAPLAVLATNSEESLRSAINTLVDGPNPPAFTTVDALARLVGPAPSRDGIEEDRVVAAVGPPPPDVGGVPARSPTRRAATTRSTSGGSKALVGSASRARGGASSVGAPDSAVASDPAAAAAHVKRGQAALSRADISAAETEFHSALRYDRRNAAALAGLGEVYFQRGALDNAKQFLRRAVKRAPKVAAYRLHLGDVYLKQLRYDDARREYGKARTLGHSAADKRLQRIYDRIGEPFSE